MKPLHDEAKPEIRKAHHWIPISISVLALIVAGLTYWQSRKQGQESKRQWEESKKQWEESRQDVRTLATPLVSVLVNTNTTDPEFGLQISNDGATAVKISEIT